MKQVSIDKTIPIELLNRYRYKCIQLLPPNAILEIKQEVGNETSPQHLIWMLQQIQSDDSMSSTKRHRWLGYIQGILVSKQSFSVQDEREYTRDIFNGN